uniref:Periplasmic chaperone PpiD n=1 Tax=Candidatus Kentrum sp. TUN TaxID=2126343 RepID=A0A450ZHB7_9GAMM|nr:MAG: peptidyl-prolyl cis-trans isomerase D [Candidatus Kentron sp. TUN]VFK54000.1 MAG: peptidyl-prolyl cis-trans isomerase D [Candidatus Kentron sp. TUN]VFK56115.1 MAG: peptidyl-prolyl cis-trans isomerase D [Candidatus Kentron sp. TUN]
MLQDIRDRAQGWIAWLLVLFISIPFALWGIHEYLGTDPNIPVAEIDGTELGLRQFQQAYRQQQTRLQNIFGADFDLRVLDERELKKNTLNELIDKQLLLREGINYGLHIGDQQLAGIIQSQQAFQDGGRFSDALYQQWLRMSGYTAGGFEYEYRRDLLVDQIQAAIADTALVGQEDIKNTLRLKEQKRIISLITIPKTRYLGTQITEDAIRDYYDSNQAEFVTAERISVDYLELSLDNLPNVPDPAEEELHALYENQQADYIEPEQRRARHILILLDPDADEVAMTAARGKLMGIKQRLEKGDAFEDLAKEYSEDTDSASQGGDLGFFRAGIMDPQFEVAAYSLVEGEVSEPVRSRFGLHLIKLTGIRPSTILPFEEVREKLLQDFQRHQKEQQFFDQAEQLANLTFGNPDTLAIAADTLGIKIEETGFFDHSGSKSPDDKTSDETMPDAIIKNRKFINAAFSEDVLSNGNNSEPVELGEYRVVVLRLKDYKPALPKPIDAVRERISIILDAEQARKQVAELGKQLVTQLQDGENLTSVSKAHEFPLRERIEIGRKNTSEIREIVDRVFRMPYPQNNSIVYDNLVTPTGDGIVVALQEVIDKESANDDTALWSTTRNTLISTYGREEYQAYVRTLRAGAKIRIHEDNL